MEALAAAGVPVYAERGSAGGFRLMDGYHMRPPGLTVEEAGALWLSGLPDAVATMGWERDLIAAQTKLLAVMGPSQRWQANLIRQRLHVEGPGWFGAADEPPHLAAVTEAVWTGRVLRVRYQSWTSESERTLEPLGLVWKGGTWYLVARDREKDAPRTYRVSSIRDCTMLAKVAERLPDFDLATYWKHASSEFIRRLYPMEATLRVSREGLRELSHIGTTVHPAGRQQVGEPDESGWRQILLPFESVPETARDLLRLGDQAEVLEPRALRDEVRRLAAGVLALMEHGNSQKSCPAGVLGSE
jgi:predicted DNA-binding transcriptional regulator YafY